MCHLEVVICLFVFFFFKQKTAYEMRISDWSSDVCSSDLVELSALAVATDPQSMERFKTLSADRTAMIKQRDQEIKRVKALGLHEMTEEERAQRSEERRVGKEGVRTCSSRWSPKH